MERKCICSVDKCVSCGACSQYCIDKSITMKSDLTIGFQIPCVEKDCMGCNFVCPQNESQIATDYQQQWFALQLKDENELVESTSGGAFYAIAKHVINIGGVVFGAVYDSDMTVHHVMARTLSELTHMRGSKYVQSDISNVYRNAESCLKENSTVLFVGLPCQVAGIKAYLGDCYQKLLTIDLICSGIPSPVLWKSYCEYYENKHHVRIIDYKFRDKHKYGLSHTTVISAKKNNRVINKTIKNRNAVSYYIAFGKQNCFMPACYQCQYNSLNRVGDFTIGGNWSIDERTSDMDVRKGVSLVLVNNDKAGQILKQIGGSSILLERRDESKTSELRKNPALYKQTSPSLYVPDLYTYLDANGYEATMNKYFKPDNTIVFALKSVYAATRRMYSSLLKKGKTNNI